MEAAADVVLEFTSVQEVLGADSTALPCAKTPQCVASEFGHHLK
jgi:uncharacterized protein (DUF1499 family)